MLHLENPNQDGECMRCDHSTERDGAKIVAARRYLPRSGKGGAQGALLAQRAATN